MKWSTISLCVHLSKSHASKLSPRFFVNEKVQQIFKISEENQIPNFINKLSVVVNAMTACPPTSELVFLDSSFFKYTQVHQPCFHCCVNVSWTAENGSTWKVEEYTLSTYFYFIIFLKEICECECLGLLWRLRLLAIWLYNSCQTLKGQTHIGENLCEERMDEKCF